MTRVLDCAWVGYITAAAVAAARMISACVYTQREKENENQSLARTVSLRTPRVIVIIAVVIDNNILSCQDCRRIPQQQQQHKRLYIYACVCIIYFRRWSVGASDYRMRRVKARFADSCVSRVTRVCIYATISLYFSGKKNSVYIYRSDERTLIIERIGIYVYIVGISLAISSFYLTLNSFWREGERYICYQLIKRGGTAAAASYRV